ncbi:MAG: glycosyltransferase [Ferruginibacter sp.]|nr:glycosyltransferase [Ferruginibacter sp.]
MKNESPVLIILSPGFAANEADTTCLTAQQNFVKAINETHPTLRIIVLSFQYPFVRSVYIWNGNTVVAFNGRNKGKLSRLLLWQKVWQYLKGLHRQNNVVGLLSFWCGECALLGKYFGTKYNLPHFCWLLGQDAKPSNHYVRYIRPSANQLVALSDFLQDQFYKNFGIRPNHVIPNGIDPKQFQHSSFDRRIDVLGVGSLIPLKQYDVFIEVISRLKMNFPGIRAVICGKGPQEEHLRLMIGQFSLQDNISLYGEMAHAEILALMQQSKLLLHPSSYEGFSTVCLEALYAGCQVISFCKPMKAPIDNWYIVSTPAEMKEKAIAILGNNHLTYNATNPFTMKATAKAMLQLFGHNVDD